MFQQDHHTTKEVHSIKSPPVPTISLADRKLQARTFVDNLFFRQVDMFLLHVSRLKHTLFNEFIIRDITLCASVSQVEKKSDQSPEKR